MFGLARTRDIDELRRLIAARDTQERIRRGLVEDALVEIRARKKGERTENDALSHLIDALEAWVS